LKAGGETYFWNVDGSWTAGPILPMPLQCHCMVHDDFKSYLIGGYKNSTDETLGHLFEYNWNTNTWTQKASMTTARSGNNVKVIDECQNNA